MAAWLVLELALILSQHSVPDANEIISFCFFDTACDFDGLHNHEFVDAIQRSL